MPAENSETASRNFDLSELAQVFTLPRSAYVRLLVVKANYRTVLPDAELLRKEVKNTRRLLESRGTLPLKTRKP